MKKRSQDRLPQHEPLPAKMAATKGGFSSVQPGSRVTPINRNPSRRRSPMPSIRPNAIRIKRFRELKADLRTRRDRLLVGIDVAKAQHVAQVRLAHTRILDKQLVIPNTQAGFATFWAHLQRRQAETGCPDIVCAVEPTGTYHEALAQFLEARGADVVLVSNTVAHANRRTLDGTWGKSDPKDAHNLGELLERGRVLFYSRPARPPRSAASCACFAGPGPSWPPARPASGTRSCRSWGPRGSHPRMPSWRAARRHCRCCCPGPGARPLQLGPRCPRPWPSSAPTSRRASSPCGPASPPSRRSWSGSPSPSRPTPGS